MLLKKQGQCLACGVTSSGGKDFICEQCGDPKKTMVVCRACQQRIDLTLVGSTMIKDFFARIDPSIDWEVVANKSVSRGIVIVIPSCSSCRGRKKTPIVGKTMIYKVRPEKAGAPRI